MDREQREQANRALHEALRAKLEANRGGLRIEDLMGQSHRDQEAAELRSNEAGRGEREQS